MSGYSWIVEKYRSVFRGNSESNFSLELVFDFQQKTKIFPTSPKATSWIPTTTRSRAWNWAAGDAGKAEEGQQGPVEKWRRPEQLGAELTPVLCLPTHLLPLFANLPVTATHLTQCWVSVFQVLSQVLTLRRVWVDNCLQFRIEILGFTSWDKKGKIG